MLPEPEIILKFVWKTFLTKIKFDRKISNLIRILISLVDLLCLLNPKDNFALNNIQVKIQ